MKTWFKKHRPVFFQSANWRFEGGLMDFSFPVPLLLYHRFAQSILLVIIFEIIGGYSCQLYAQERPNDIKQDLKVGLALSGGGAKGIAHIGVLRVIEEAGIEVDYIAGTSIGSIVGAFYALGYSPTEMEIIASETDWEQIFIDKPNRPLLSMYEKEVDERFIASFPITDRGIKLPPGLVAGQNIYTWLAKYTWPAHGIDDFSEFQIPFATVATDLETGEAVIFRSGYLPDAIRASISLPSLLIPYEVDGRTLIDGGFIRNLPVQELLDMGADYVIAVDVSSPLRSMDNLNSIAMIMNQTMNFRVIDNINQQKELADLVIEVDELDKFTIVDFDQTDNFIQIGEQASRRWMKDLKTIADKQQPDVRTRVPFPERDTIRVTGVSIEGNDQIPGSFIRTELEISENDRITSNFIEQSIQGLYSTRLFNLITYKLLNDGEDNYHLQIRVIENTNDSFRVGVRYETETQASIRLHAAFQNLLQRGSSLRLDLRLGREIGIQADHLYFRGIRSRFGLRTRLQYKAEEIHNYSSGNRVSSLKNHLIRAEMFSGTFLNNTFLLGLGLRKDFIKTTLEINPELIPFSNKDHHAVYGLLWADSFNRRSYPTKGHRLIIQGSLSDPFFLSPLSFNEQHVYWRGWYPVNKVISIQHTIFAGRSYGEELPWNYWFTLNKQHDMIGFTRFGGYNRYELAGRNIQMGSAGVQFEVARHRFVRFNLYAGGTMDNWTWNMSESDFKTGYSISAGVLTILGPIEAIISGSQRHKFLFELQVGYKF